MVGGWIGLRQRRRAGSISTHTKCSRKRALAASRRGALKTPAPPLPWTEAPPVCKAARVQDRQPQSTVSRTQAPPNKTTRRGVERRGRERAGTTAHPLPHRPRPASHRSARVPWSRQCGRCKLSEVPRLGLAVASRPCATPDVARGLLWTRPCWMSQMRGLGCGEFLLGVAGTASLGGIVDGGR